jgi:hypothetical protein
MFTSARRVTKTALKTKAPARIRAGDVRCVECLGGSLEWVTSKDLTRSSDQDA